MEDHHALHLHEEIMLLALRDEQGTVASGSMITYAVGGAILAELLLANRIAVEADKRRKLVQLSSAEPLGDPLLDECLGRVASAKRRASLRTWVTRFAGIKDLQRRIAERLCERRILRAEEGTFLLVFSRTTYPEADPKPERELIERLRQAIFTESRQIDPRTVVLLSLADKADLLKNAFEKSKLKSRRARIAKVVNGELVGAATREAIEAVQIAIAVAVIIPAITVTTSSNG